MKFFTSYFLLFVEVNILQTKVLATYIPNFYGYSINCEPRFGCLDGVCIPMTWVCDGDEDCTHGEDEYCSQIAISSKVEEKGLPPIWKRSPIHESKNLKASVYNEAITLINDTQIELHKGLNSILEYESESTSNIRKRNNYDPPNNTVTSTETTQTPFPTTEETTSFSTTAGTTSYSTIVTDSVSDATITTITTSAPASAPLTTKENTEPTTTKTQTETTTTLATKETTAETASTSTSATAKPSETSETATTTTAETTTTPKTTATTGTPAEISVTTTIKTETTTTTTPKATVTTANPTETSEATTTTTTTTAEPCQTDTLDVEIQILNDKVYTLLKTLLQIQEQLNETECSKPCPSTATNSTSSTSSTVPPSSSTTQHPTTEYEDHLPVISKVTCPYHFRNIDGDCIYVQIYPPVSWFEASSICNSQNSHLIYIKTKKFFEKLLKQLNFDEMRVYDFWIGATNHHQHSNGQWSWSDGSFVTSFDAWSFNLNANKADIFVDHHKPHQCAFLDGRLYSYINGIGCHEHKGFICQFSI